jgi:serine/threonine protein kinase
MSLHRASSEPARTARLLALSEGSVVDGKYRIESQIAEGGMAVVFRATHVGLGQRVAIKFLKPAALSDAVLVERFEREARLLAQIASEHVVRVQDVGNFAGVGPYMVMEYLVGRDLGSIVEEGPLPIIRAVDYVLQACDALAEAHALRIVHRDIKPENMFLAQRPSNTAILKLIDFGISKVAPKRGEGANWAHATASDDRVGTPLYMSPEQLRSPKDVDQRADIWGLGVVLFELITGTQVFDAVDMPGLCASILTGAPKPLRAVLPEAPMALEQVILKCLEKDPARRFRNVAELTQELMPFGPVGTASRVVRIKQVVRRGGSSIRPPTPAAVSVYTVPIVVEQSAAGSDPVSAAAVEPPQGRWPLRRIGVVALAGLAVCGVLGLVAMTRSSPTPFVPSTALPAVSTEAPSPVAPPQEANPILPAESSAPAVSSTSEVAAPPAAPARKAGAARTPSAASSPLPPSDRRGLFGERK